MTICQYCGNQIDGQAPKCAKCGAKLVAFSDDDPRKIQGGNVEQWNREKLSMPAKWGYWLAAWGCVAGVALLTVPQLILGAPFFPIGLLGWLPDGVNTAIKAWMLGGFVAGWLLYVALSVAMFRTQRRRIFFRLYVLLCILIALNLVGCYKVTNAVAHIQ